MQHLYHKSRILLLIAMVVVVISSFGQGSLVQADTQTDGVQNTNFIDENDQLLVWTAPAHVPGLQSVEQVGELGYTNSTGSFAKVADVLAQSHRVETCGYNGVSPDGRHTAIFQGIDGGVTASLYVITDAGEPVLINDAFQRVGCYGGNGILSFSPDSSRMAYIRYERQFTVDFADGSLHVLNTSDWSEIFTSRNATAFDQSADGIVFATFFTNDREEADEVAVTWWDGNVDRELMGLIAEEDCRYLNAHVEIAPDGHIWVGLATRCSGTTNLEMYRINPEDRSHELLFTTESGGAYSTSAATNSIYFSTDGSVVYYTVPDGVTSSTASLNSYDVASGSNSVVIREQMVVQSLGDTANAGAAVSPDGKWLATAVTSRNLVDNSLHLINLADPTADILRIQAGGEGDTISYMGYTRDSSALVYVSGGDDGKDNSLFRLNLGDAPSEERIRRGVYTRWATLNPAGNEIAILEHQVQDETIRGPDYVNLVVVNLDTSEFTTLFEGGEIIDDEVQNLQFAAPITWYRQ